jgi:hypothetical protein
MICTKNSAASRFGPNRLLNQSAQNGNFSRLQGLWKSISLKASALRAYRLLRSNQSSFGSCMAAKPRHERDLHGLSRLEVLFMVFDERGRRRFASPAHLLQARYGPPRKPRSSCGIREAASLRRPRAKLRLSNLRRNEGTQKIEVHPIAMACRVAGKSPATGCCFSGCLPRFLNSKPGDRRRIGFGLWRPGNEKALVH